LIPYRMHGRIRQTPMANRLNQRGTMDFEYLKRWGLLLSILEEMSDIELQVVAQVSQPAQFVPDSLLDRWDNTFQGGVGLLNTGLSNDILSIVIEFDIQLDNLIDVVPGDTIDKEDYIRHDSVWQIICEMAEFTLMQIVSHTVPEDPVFSEN
jgi:hypothetical protein